MQSRSHSQNRTRALVTAAALVALAIGFQNLRLLIGTTPVSTYLIGSLVNLCLIVAAVGTGLLPGLAVALLTPLVAFLQGFANIAMMPWIVAGNVALVAAFVVIAARPAPAADKRRALIRWCVAGVTAAVVKYLLIVLGMALMLSGNKGVALNGAILGTAFVQQIQQPVTAVVAMLVAPAVLRGLKRAGVVKG